MRCGDEARLIANGALINLTEHQRERNNRDFEGSIYILSGNGAPCWSPLKVAGFLAVMFLSSERPSTSSPVGFLREKETSVILCETNGDNLKNG